MSAGNCEECGVAPHHGHLLGCEAGGVTEPFERCPTCGEPLTCVLFRGYGSTRLTCRNDCIGRRPERYTAPEERSSAARADRADLPAREDFAADAAAARAWRGIAGALAEAGGSPTVQTK